MLFHCLISLACLTNGGIVEDGFLPSDHRAGKISRHQKISKSSDGKHQAVSSGKENIEVGSLHIERRLKEANIHDNFGSNSSKFYRFTLSM